MSPRFGKVSLLVCAVLVACSDPGPANPVQVEATLSPATISLGGSTSVSLEITNTSLQPIAVALGGCERLFELVDASGAILDQPGRVCLTMIISPTVVEPGASVSASDRWFGEARGPGGDGVNVRPGVYFIRPRVSLLENGFAYGPKVQVTVTGSAMTTRP